MTKIKTVYILGAGFSIEAGAPSQEKLVSKIFEIHENEPYVFGDKKIEKFRSFLKTTLNIPENYQKTIPLEDIFTPLDSCIANNISFRNVCVEFLKKSRHLVFELIGLTLQHILRDSNKAYIDIFSKYLVQESKKRLQTKQDLISIISTNWDILLDNSIYNEIRNQQGLGVVDYCCYISSYDKHDKTVKPGLEILGKGGFNTKLLKLHGSLNWLQCPKCQRIYVKFNQKIAMNPFDGINKPRCRHCDENFYKTGAHNLQANLIMPTFLKDLSNPQYKIIWQNAGIELSEAKKIVFIGYSLPQADFEMRQLLSRMVDSRTEIEVVDYQNEHYPEIFNNLCKNYEQFFGRAIKSYNLGTSNYIDTEIRQKIDNNTGA
jgi:NAD-dependent SIR2 family protein deacetylase